jgi:hypothetical protein
MHGRSGRTVERIKRSNKRWAHPPEEAFLEKARRSPIRKAANSLIRKQTAHRQAKGLSAFATPGVRK